MIINKINHEIKFLFANESTEASAQCNSCSLARGVWPMRLL